MSANACIEMDWHDGPPSVQRTEIRKARKDHKCCECGETIKSGRTYEHVAGNWEGSWLTFKTCTRCALIRDDYFRSWVYGQCVEAFYEAHGFDYRDGLP